MSLFFTPAAWPQACGGGVGDGTCCGDVDGDGAVTQADLGIAIAESESGCTGCCLADVDWDGDVDDDDIAIITSEMNENGEGQPCIGYRPIPLKVWDPNCYSGGCGPTCQDDKGCLPMDTNQYFPSLVSFSDVDGDGWPDAASWATIDGARKRRLYRNSGDAGNPLSWTEVCLDPNMDPNSGYGAHLADYNNDGYPDYATSRDKLGAVDKFFFLVNAGDPNSCFVSVRECLGLPSAIPSSETLVWGDVDGDLDLELFLPAYETTPPDPNDPVGNHLFLNLDPNTDGDCPQGPPTIVAMDPNWGIPAGLQKYNDYRRPEGCILVDYDRDGDGDLFFSGRVWQNVTTADDDPNFSRLDPDDTGFSVFGNPEEGLAAADVDLDGDLDFIQMGTFENARLQKSRGDGTFGSYGGFDTASYGVSMADWDNDGDIDFTAGETFWRNMLLERFYESPATSLWQQVYCLDDGVYDPVYSACPAWADVDRDGDLDCARGAHTQQNGSTLAKFQRNYLYHGGTCADCEPTKRYVNVRPVRAAPDNGPNGWRDYSECELGAFVELVVRNHPDPNMAQLRRVQFTSTAAGYLNQNEYPPHFGLPGDPEPNDPDEDLHFDVYVDFLARGDEPNAGSGLWRVDWTVNPQLADINLADLYVDCNDPDPETLGRPVTVYRDGRVRFKGADPNQAPSDPNIARLHTLGGPLTLPTQGGGSLPGLTTGNVFAGVRFNKEPDSPELRIREIIVDGQLDQTTSGCDYNVVVLDVTDPNNPSTVGGLKAYTFSDNRRTIIHVPPQDPNNPDFVLPECDSSTTRKYEIRVRVTKYRMNTLPDPTGLTDYPGVTVDKGLNLVNVLMASGTLCTQSMTLRNDTQKPVTIRLSPTGN